MKRFSIFVVAIVALLAAIAISTGHSDGNEAIASSHDATPTPTATLETVWRPLDCSHVHPNHTYERYRMFASITRVRTAKSLVKRPAMSLNWYRSYVKRV